MDDVFKEIPEQITISWSLYDHIPAQGIKNTDLGFTDGFVNFIGELSETLQKIGYIKNTAEINHLGESIIIKYKNKITLPIAKSRAGIDKNDSTHT